MEAYHHMLVHFPLALWTTGAIIILIRTFSAGGFALAADRVLAPILWLGTAIGLLAYATGLLVWSLEAITYTPMGRNHILAATWTLAYWVLIAVLRQRVGEAVWTGRRRWLMLLLGALGGVLLAVAGTLGGHLTGSATALSSVLRVLGWEVYTTFYMPLWMIIVTCLVAVSLVIIGLRSRHPG
ncbi:heme ABC transporter permease [Sulfuriflexus sp.]|uniref:heme ABC transporter permease n=1 Tax=Sulfuriflexus sp. TaxID=2015443 RepID=UPI0028CC3F63|nr:heme ABC transporter permease [Sulfuriflexus sp.]MDT8404609.1 heme ABC transporter permease [Sulfuriflexus sp.]